MALVVSACGGGSGGAVPADSGSPVASGVDGDSAAAVDSEEMSARLGRLHEAVTAWSDAATIADARSAAEEAVNLVVGPNGPGYGDRDGDGRIEGESDVGLLSGAGGEPAGLATRVTANECVVRDVLGATATDVDAGWAEMERAISEWRPDDNTMPSLASHPMRVVGWATFTLESESLDDAHEYAGHARLHVDISQAALNC